MRSSATFFCLLVAFCAIAIVLSAEVNPSNNVQASLGRKDLVLPKLFDFDHFKTLFKKKYASLLEELARKKIFLGRAFGAFISMIGFKNNKRNHYLKINEMSDWTDSEHKALFTKRSLRNVQNNIPMAKKPTDVSRTPVANIEDVQAIIKDMSGKPGYADLEAELQSKSRSRRAALEATVSEPLDRKTLTIHDLIANPIEEENESFDEIPSSNPHYEPPELTSFGTEDTSKTQNTLDESEHQVISKLSGYSYLSSLVSSAQDYFFGRASSDLSNKELETSEKQSRLRPAKKLGNEVIIDHRRSGCLDKPKNQKDCGSCYIFSTTGLYEWQYCQETGIKGAFSEQYPLDCGERVHLNGCGSGQEYDVAAFYGRFGLELKQHYPYKAVSDICPYDPNSNPKVMGYVKLNYENGGMVGIKYEYLETFLRDGPVAMGIGVADDFGQYGGGVDDGKGCIEDNGHSMIIIGMGVQDGVEYWLFRNSYGPYWGEDGHYRLAKSAWRNCLLDDGLGFILEPSEGSTIFKNSHNRHYDHSFVDKRYSDDINHIPIEHNPFTYIDPNAIDPNAVVNRE